MIASSVVHMPFDEEWEEYDEEEDWDDDEWGDDDEW